MPRRSHEAGGDQREEAAQSSFAAEPRLDQARNGIAWLTFGLPAATQGWKIHVSARHDGLAETKKLVLRISLRYGAAAKIVSSANGALRLNAGDGGITQVGKIATIYTESAGQCRAIARDLNAGLRHSCGPIVENELRPFKHSPIYLRYGAFSTPARRTLLGLPVTMVSGGERVLPDTRVARLDRHLGIESPFPKAVSTEIPRIFGDRFLRVATLAETQHSRVLLCADLETGISCALKIVRAHTFVSAKTDAVSCLRQEFHSLCALESRSVTPRPIGYFEWPGYAGLAMEYLSGHSLVALTMQMATNGAIDGVDVDATLERFLDAVAIVHRANIGLGDISPANVMLLDDGSVRVLDLEQAGPLDSLLAGGRPRSHGYAHGSRGAISRRRADLLACSRVLFAVSSGVELARIAHPSIAIRSGAQLPSARVQRAIHALRGTRADPLRDATLALRGDSGTRADTSVGTSHENAKLSVSLARRTARDLADYLLTVADRTQDGSLSWRTRHPSFAPLRPRDINVGESGVCLALMRAGVMLADADLLLEAARTVERLVREVEDDPNRLAGLFVGDAGVGYCCMVLHVLTHDNRFLDLATRVSDAIADTPRVSPDLFHGIAGRALFHTWLFAIGKRNAERQRAAQLREELLSRADRTHEEVSWPIPKEFDGLEGSYRGWAHGTAGILFALGEMEAVVPSRSGRELVGLLVRQLTGARELRPDGRADWRHAPGGTFRCGTLCHGSIGIALSATRAQGLVDEGSWNALAQSAAQSALERAHVLDASLCHGTTGLIEVLLEINQRAGSREHDAAIGRLVGDLIGWFVRREGRHHVVGAEQPSLVTPDLFVGVAGIVATLARVAEPERFGFLIGHPLRWLRSHSYPRTSSELPNRPTARRN